MMRGLLRRWLVFAAAFGLSLLPGAISLMVLPRLAELPRILELAWIWLLMAVPAGGFARIDYDGAVWFAATAWLISLLFWVVAGLVFALALLQVRLRTCLILSLPSVVGTGLLAQYLLSLAGISSFTYL